MLIRQCDSSEEDVALASADSASPFEPALEAVCVHLVDGETEDDASLCFRSALFSDGLNTNPLSG